MDLFIHKSLKRLDNKKKQYSSNNERNMKRMRRSYCKFEFYLLLWNYVFTIYMMTVSIHHRSVFFSSIFTLML